MDRTVNKISTYAASLSYSDLTPEALHAVKRSLIDSIGLVVLWELLPQSRSRSLGD
jgi:2-methylcitrate dehydratase PrpD